MDVGSPFGLGLLQRSGLDLDSSSSLLPPYDFVVLFGC